MLRGTSLRTVFFLTLSASGLARGEEWELIDESDGIQSFSQKSPGQTAIGVRGLTTMDVPIELVAQVLLDPDGEKRKEWVDLISEFTFLQYEGNLAYTYSLVDLPWPLQDRDFVVRNELSFDDVKHELVLKFESGVHPKAPATPGIRGEVSQGFYRLTALSRSSTRVEVQTQVNLKGLIPIWIVNLGQKNWPHKTLTAMKAMAQKPQAKANDLVLKRLEEWQLPAVDTAAASKR